MTVNGYELLEGWQWANMSETAKAKKGTKTYILKKYTEIKAPIMDESMTESLFAKLKAKFDRFVNYRKRINSALLTMTGPGGNIISPCESFIYENQFVEVTEFIPGLIEGEAIYAFTPEELHMTMLTIVGALYNIHRKNIVHSDLKEPNIVVTVNSVGNKVGKIIDFDRSYFADEIIPEYVGGSQNFMSPELVYLYINDMAEEATEYLSCKADIYSLGIVFHKYLTHGKYPEISGIESGPLKKRLDRGEVVYCGEASLAGAKLHVSSEIKEKYLRRLIANMLTQDPEKRISAFEVLSVLKNKTVLPVVCETIIVDGDEEDSEPTPVTVSSYVPETTTRAVGFAEPWPEHMIELDADALSSANYVSLERVVLDGLHCYRLYKSTGTKRDLTLQNLLILDLAKKIGSSTEVSSTASTSKTEIGEAAVWDEHSDFEFDMDAISAAGYVEVRRAEKSSIRGYMLVKRNGVQKFFVFENMKAIGYLKLK